MRDIRKKDKVGPILVSSVKDEFLTAKLLALGVEFDSDASIKEKLTLFMEWTEEQLKDFDSRGEDYAVCENCDAPCHPTWSACPVCGTGDTEIVEEEEPVEEYVAEVIPKEEAPRAIMKIVDLDEAVARARRYQEEAMRSYYNLGKEIASIHGSKVYKLRVDKHGRPMYNSWNEFCEAEIGLSGSRCLNIANVCEKFSEDQVETLGVEKLRIIMKADPKDIPKLLEAAPEKTTKELQKIVIPGPKPTEGTLGKKLKMNEERLGTEAAKASRMRKQLQQSGKEITTAIQMVTHDVEMVPGEGSGTFQGEETLVNGVRVKYEFIKEDNQRILRISYKRSVEDEEPVV